MKNIKLNFTALLIFISIFTQAQNIKNGQIIKNIKGLNLIIDKRIEMLTVIQYLAESKMVSLDEITYLDNVSKYFAEYKNHKVVNLYKDLEKLGFAYDAPPHTMLFLDADFKIVKKINKEIIQRVSFNKKLLNEFILQLQDFNTTTNFDKFFNDNSAILYKSIEILVDSSFKNFDEINTLEKFYGYKQNSYNIVLSALELHGGYGVKMLANNGNYDIYNIMGTWGHPVNKIPFFGEEKKIKYVVWHEFGHSFVNPLVGKYYKEFDKYSELAKPIQSAMESQAYPDWETILNEHIIRAITSTLAYEKYGKEKADAELNAHRSIGFIYIDSLYSKILAYSQNNSKTNFKEFFPKLIDVIKEYSVNPVKIEKSIPTPFSIFMSKDDNYIIIYPTNESSNSLNDSIKSYIENINKKFLKLTDDKILADTIALKRNLRDFTIICYGSYKGNLWFKSKIKDFPIEISDDKIIAKQSINQSNLRLIATWLNPDNPDKNVIFYTAQKSNLIFDIQQVDHGVSNYLIANEKFEVIEKGNYKYSDGKFILK